MFQAITDYARELTTAPATCCENARWVAQLGRAILARSDSDILALMGDTPLVRRHSSSRRTMALRLKSLRSRRKHAKARRLQRAMRLVKNMALVG